MKHTMQYQGGEDTNKQEFSIYLFIYSSHDDAVEISDFTETKDRMINKMKKCGRKQFLSYFNVHSLTMA
jgi:hypothetical protein